MTACETDPTVAERSMKVANLIDPPTRLLSTMWRVAMAKRHRRRANRPADTKLAR